MKSSTRFRHESIQDRESIKTLLKALTNGIGKGEIILEDPEGALAMQPAQLLRLKITGSVDDGRNRLDIRISWQGDRELPRDKPIKIKSR